MKAVKSIESIESKSPPHEVISCCIHSFFVVEIHINHMTSRQRDAGQ